MASKPASASVCFTSGELQGTYMAKQIRRVCNRHFWELCSALQGKPGYINLQLKPYGKVSFLTPISEVASYTSFFMASWSKASYSSASSAGSRCSAAQQKGSGSGVVCLTFWAFVFRPLFASCVCRVAGRSAMQRPCLFSVRPTIAATVSLRGKAPCLLRRG